MATLENAVTVLRQAICGFGVPATILSDNEYCFVGRSGHRTQTGTWTPTLFENEMLTLNVDLINSRPYRPQINGKLERLHKSLENEIWNYPSLGDYIKYYNTDRLHLSSDIDN